MRRAKDMRRIVVNDIAYRWVARGDEGYIVITLSPANNAGSRIRGNMKYHETWLDCGNGVWRSAGDQIVITNRLVRRIIEYALAHCEYDPNVKGKELNLKVLDDVIRWDDAVRASRTQT
ncbi:MAG TPA: hypothetical protein VGE74_24705 [Gemmata sp.]